MPKIKKYTLELLNTIISNYNATLIGHYDIINKDTIVKFKCKCGNIRDKLFYNIYIRGSLCITCTKLEKLNRFKQTNLERYGVEFALQNNEIKDKLKETNLERYGVKCVSQNPKIRDKTKKTNLERYGAEHVSKCKDVRDKAKKTTLERFGVEFALQNKEVIDKLKKTNLDKYGVEYGLLNSNIKEKTKKTNLEKYGVENPSQNPEIAEKNTKNSFKSKNYKLPSGNTIKVQGYEPWALDILFKKYSEHQLVISDKTKVPEIWWVDSNGKRHRYYVDIYIPEENKLIEVKSQWTYKTTKFKEKINQVPLQSIDQGYKYEYWVFDKNRNLTIVNEFNKL